MHKMNSAVKSVTRSYLALGAVVGPILFTLAWVVLGFVNTGYTLWGVHVAHYSAIQQQISALGVGNTAPFMNLAFVTTGVLLLMGTIGIFRVLRSDLSPRAYKWGLALWLLPGIGCITDGIFTFEQAFLHFIGFGFSLLSIFGFIFTGLALRRSFATKHTARWLMSAGPLTAALTILFFATFTPTAAGQLTGIAGLTERLLVTEILWWYVVMGWMAFQGEKVNRQR
jgi:hypothetical membrane protein